jgi:hypothetical protein
MQEITTPTTYPRTQRPMMNTYRQISRFNRKLTCLRDVIPCSDSKISPLLLPRMAPPAFDTHEDINRRYTHQPQHSLARPSRSETHRPEIPHRPRPAAQAQLISGSYPRILVRSQTRRYIYLRLFRICNLVLQYWRTALEYRTLSRVQNFSLYSS